MKMMKITSTAVLSLLLGIAAPVYAQHEQQDEKQDHPGQEQSKPSSRRPGKSIAHEAGSRTTATGSSAAGTTAIAFRTTAIADILARTTASAFTGCLF